MNPLWKLLPWGVAGAAVVAAVLAFGAQQRAIGRAQAAIAEVQILKTEFAKDSAKREIERLARAAERADADRAITRARANQAQAATRADELAAELAAALDTTQRVKLQAIVAEHAKERLAWDVERVGLTSKLRLAQAEIADLTAENDGLRRINRSLERATADMHKAHSPIVQYGGYVIGAAGLAYGIVTAATN